ncbi:MAG TPA: hypothetical protein VHO29_12050 [Marmoricola sp.]|nr:hypothetical protein [Marmoricola sp.]
MGLPLVVAALVVAVGAAAILAVVTVLVLRGRRSRADLEEMLLAARRETDELRRRLDELTGDRRTDAPVARSHREATEAFVITHVGDPDEVDQSALSASPVPDRLVLSATLGEPLVKVAAFSHGVRRALSPESRNRIWFEVRREVRASRRRRRALRKRLEREYRANLRAAEDVA